ncbi:hypothetical protein TWF106_002757 [Orbilia oligospora]|uniref:RRM domain-containing protein n=1 Tax=Orbilia oligospora TaxID=2813651 RepID=A0A6G1LT53_ORBOL|nr:hypothetical protein TWF788_003770 [Orbilia oligospora]KAF3197880.1 hypothetical protein TWF679_002511 [Orbilia oligospora]KAF3201711.1 hypothetical protein TWF106_002757 [Orbilia oligospora]KAF3230540.1 hypothetical protein TWF191_009454 [Orbilia oligospora]KAF3233033.1 hypothetical protein TWF192_002581 [Orbilia oligospora]
MSTAIQNKLSRKRPRIQTDPAEATNTTDSKMLLREAEDAAKTPITEIPGVIYLGRIPHGFYEDEMRAYFSQFGTIDRLRLCRNKATGKSKHYAFIQFSSVEVARIVADTMNNYLLYGHILKCKLLAECECDENMWIGANRKWKVAPLAKIRRLRHERRRPPEVWNQLQRKENRRRLSKVKRWQTAGISYSLG